MKDVLVFVAAVFGAIMLAFGNSYGLIGLIPALILIFQDAKNS